LINAGTLAEAYDKAVKIGKEQTGRFKSKRGWMKYRFVGIWEIFDIWDDIGDGEELYYTDHGNITGRVAKQRCVTKRQCLDEYSTPIGQKPKTSKSR